MNRLLVAVLAAFDALLAVAVGIALVLAPATVLWAIGFGAAGDWSLLWPTSVRIWQLAHLVPVELTLPDAYLAETGIPADAATFTLSLAPLALAVFTASFAARSGARAARAGAWPTGVATGTVAVALASSLLLTTSQLSGAAVSGALAVIAPTLLFAVPAVLGAVVTAWRIGDDGPVDSIRNAVRSRPGMPGVVEAAARGALAAVTALVALGALAVALAALVRGGEVVALFEASHVDLLGAVMLGIGQLAYLPTLIGWGAAFVAGPGVLLGTGATVSPAATTLGVVPGVPVFGLIPEGGAWWMLLSVLLVIGAGVLAGWIARRRLLAEQHVERSAPRAIVLVAVVVSSAVSAAVLAMLTSGSIGPDRLRDVGPQPGPLALAVGVEIAIGAAIGLLAPVRRSGGRPSPADGADGVDEPAAALRVPAPWVDHGEPATVIEPQRSESQRPATAPVAAPTADDADTQPVDDWLHDDEGPPAAADAAGDDADTQPIDDWLHDDGGDEPRR